MYSFLKTEVQLVRRYKAETLQIVTLFMILVIFALGLINFIKQENTNSQNIKQVKQIAQNIDTILKDQALNANTSTAQGQQQLKTISQELQCIGDFFAQTDRANIVVSNLNQCTLSVVNSPGGAIGSTKSGVNNGKTNNNHGNKPSSNASSPSTATPSTQGQGSPSPKPSLIQRVHNLLGL